MKYLEKFLIVLIAVVAVPTMIFLVGLFFVMTMLFQHSREFVAGFIGIAIAIALLVSTGYMVVKP
ncbi:hypothetical protein HDG34_005837 [Paraburkholderia sp. HC6.4b]|uniref:hypothetical protein n=1 Tax=unclassified Paraburkholderia TaxID=2615204 RepID=UPI0016173C5C|nr:MULTISPECIES: hypothetical protein [unclassified Paraburkholderia]MBB5411871.1 hypothetical protein [Paraburkholderia sp. HC6.4b]MBB5450183.1 hypothetical protein [Paraburkholderia sp. Kb1A]